MEKERKDLEWFLRRNFGLKGEFFSNEFKKARAIPDQEESDEAIYAILEKKGPEGLYTKAAWNKWQQALDLVADLEEVGAISEDVGHDIARWFCDNA